MSWKGVRFRVACAIAACSAVGGLAAEYVGVAGEHLGSRERGECVVRQGAATTLSGRRCFLSPAPCLPGLALLPRLPRLPHRAARQLALAELAEVADFGRLAREEALHHLEEHD